MEPLEILALAFYMSFAFGYMINTLGIDEADSAWIIIIIMLLALTLGMLWFPIVFSIDVYNKLHE